MVVEIFFQFLKPFISHSDCLIYIDNACQEQFSCSNTGTAFTTKDGLSKAVDAYINDKASGIAAFGAINCWNVSSITDMSYLFYDKYFNEDISCWDVSQVTSMDNMFEYAWSFNQNLDSWSVDNVSSMGYMFYDASVFNQNLGGWNVSRVTNMNYMFSYASRFDQSLCHWFDSLSGNVPYVYGIFLNSGCSIRIQPDFVTTEFFCQRCRPYIEGGGKFFSLNLFFSPWR